MGTQATEERLPDALGKRHKVISLSEGGTFVVTRWTLAKTIMMASWCANAVKDMTDFDPKSMDKTEFKDFMEIAMRFIRQLGDKVPEFLELSVEPIDRAVVREMAADDALDVIHAIIELNITDKFLGKVKGLIATFKSRFGANAKTT